MTIQKIEIQFILNFGFIVKLWFSITKETFVKIMETQPEMNVYYIQAIDHLLLLSVIDSGDSGIEKAKAFWK